MADHTACTDLIEDFLKSSKKKLIVYGLRDITDGVRTGSPRSIGYYDGKYFDVSLSDFEYVMKYVSKFTMSSNCGDTIYDNGNCIEPIITIFETK